MRSKNVRQVQVILWIRRFVRMRTKWPELSGHLSRMLMVMFDPASGKQGELVTAHRGTVSLTNRSPAFHRHGLDLPGRQNRTRPGCSLSNILTEVPAACPDRSLPHVKDAHSDRREAPPVSEAVRFYRLFISGLLERHPDVKGVHLKTEIGIALDEARAMLPAKAAALLPDTSTLSEPKKFLVAPAPSLERHGIDGHDIGTVRLAYLTVLQKILERLSDRVDPTVVKLVFRLAARKALGERMVLVERYFLLEGIAQNYLRQVGS
jgi:hypothetical protein